MLQISQKSTCNRFVVYKKLTQLYDIVYGYKNHVHVAGQKNHVGIRAKVLSYQLHRGMALHRSSKENRRKATFRKNDKKVTVNNKEIKLLFFKW